MFLAIIIFFYILYSIVRRTINLIEAYLFLSLLNHIPFYPFSSPYFTVAMMSDDELTLSNK